MAECTAWENFLQVFLWLVGARALSRNLSTKPLPTEIYIRRTQGPCRTSEFSSRKTEQLGFKPYVQSKFHIFRLIFVLLAPPCEIVKRHWASAPRDSPSRSGSREWP